MLDTISPDAALGYAYKALISAGCKNPILILKKMIREMESTPPSEAESLAGSIVIE